jgi:phospholipase C
MIRRVTASLARRAGRGGLVVACALFAASCGGASPSSPATVVAATGIHKIRHVVIIFQENRSFDSYFGTYPGADGIPMADGVPTVCVPDPATGACVKPYLDHADLNGGGPHDAVNSTADINGGKMTGFIAQAQKGKRRCADPTNPVCTHGRDNTDVMGYHDGSDIPNYWAYAQHYVLQDHMYESVHSWSFPSHLYLISGWAANCTNPQDPATCSSSLDPKDRTETNPTPFGWTNLTYLLAEHHVSWGWYLDHGAIPDKTPVSSLTITAKTKTKKKRSFANNARSVNGGVPEIWNVLPGFTEVGTQTGAIKDQASFFAQAKSGTLPAVSWVLPNAYDSEHPPALVSVGQSYVTNVVNAVMASPDWNSTAIFVTWDDWGGFYDQVVPPTVDALGYGIRVPGLVISPYAKSGYVDHQTLSFDAYLKFIEDDFLGGARLDPRTDGRPDPRPTVREDAPILGNLVNDFDFNQTPRPPMILPTDPTTTLVCPSGVHPGVAGRCPGAPVAGSG